MHEGLRVRFVIYDGAEQSLIVVADLVQQPSQTNIIINNNNSRPLFSLCYLFLLSCLFLGTAASPASA